VRGDGEAAAEIVHVFVRRGFDADGVSRQSGRNGERGFHRGNLWGDLWAGGDQRGVDIHGCVTKFF
jgi:hypothetical protein